MKPSQITRIILRLFALSWLLTGVLQTVALAFLGSLRFGSLGGGAIMVGLAAVVWWLAPRLGRLVAGEDEQASVIHEVSYPQLFHTMLAGLGVYFCLSSLGNLLTAFYYFTLMRAIPEDAFSPQMVRSSAELSQYGITFAAGLLLVFTAPNLVRKLTGRSAA